MASSHAYKPNRLDILGWVRGSAHGERLSTDLSIIRNAVKLRAGGRKVAITQIEGELADVDLSPRLLHRERGQVD